MRLGILYNLFANLFGFLINQFDLLLSLTLELSYLLKLDSFIGISLHRFFLPMKAAESDAQNRDSNDSGKAYQDFAGIGHLRLFDRHGVCCCIVPGFLTYELLLVLTVFIVPLKVDVVVPLLCVGNLTTFEVAFFGWLPLNPVVIGHE